MQKKWNLKKIINSQIPDIKITNEHDLNNSMKSKLKNLLTTECNIYEPISGILGDYVDPKEKNNAQYD